jgi:hypothetical protein
MGFIGPGDIAVTIDGDFVVIDSGALVHVDQTTGDRTIISKFAPLDKDRTGGGPRFGNNGIAVTTDGDFVVIGSDSVVHVDQTSGDRTILSDDRTGSGPGFVFPEDIAVTIDGDFVVIGWDSVVHVDQTTGDRTILSDDLTGCGPGFIFAVGIAVTTDGDFVVIDIVDGLGGFGAVVHVDQFTGDRTIISDATTDTGSGPGFENPEDIAVTIDGDFVVIDEGLGAVVHVDQFTGDRTILSDDSTGGGPGFLIPKYIAVTIDGDFVVSETEARIKALVHVDQFTGDRTILSDATTGTGP